MATRRDWTAVLILRVIHLQTLITLVAPVAQQKARRRRKTRHRLKTLLLDTPNVLYTFSKEASRVLQHFFLRGM